MRCASWQKPPRGAILDVTHPLAKGLVGCWLFNEMTGDKVFDYSLNGNHGTLTNMDPATDWVGSARGPSLDFERDNQRVEVARSSSIEPSPVSAVVGHIFDSTPPGTEYEQLLAKDKSSWSEPYYSYNLRVRAGHNYVEVQINVDGTRTEILTPNDSFTWGLFHQVSFTWDKSSLVLYIDCSSWSTSASGNSIQYWDTPLYFGYDANYSTGRAGGKMLYVYLYSRGLSSDEIQWLYQEPYAMFLTPAKRAYFYIPLGVAKAYEADVLLKKLDIEKAYTTDVLLQKKDITSTYSVDALLAATLSKDVSVDALLKKLGITEAYSVDALIQKLGIPKEYTVDVLLEVLNTLGYSVDVLIERLGIQKEYAVDLLLRKTLEKGYSIDALLDLAWKSPMQWT